MTRDRPERAVLPPLSRHAVAVIALGSACTFAQALNLSIMYVAFPELVDAFPEASTAELSWVLNIYTVVTGAFLVLGGVVGDRWGRKRAALSGLTLFALAGLTYAAAPNPTVLIGARAVQAVAAALIAPNSVALILQEVPVQRRASAMATWSAIGAGAAAAGPALGGLLMSVGGWQAAFWIAVPIAAVVVPLGIRTFDESRAPVASPLPDAVSTGCLIGGMVLVILALTQSAAWGWTSSRTITCFLVGGSLLAILVVRSLRVPNPVIDLELFRIPAVRTSAFLVLGFGVGFFAMFFGTVLFTSDVWGWSTTAAGLAITPVPVAMALLGSPAGRLADRHGHRGVAVTGSLCFAAGSLLLTLRVDDEPDLWGTWLPAMTIIGVGGALVWTAIYGASVHGVPSDRFTAAAAVNQTVQRVGQALGVSFGVTIVGRWDPGDGVGAYRGIFLLMTASGVLGAAIGATLRTAPTSVAAVAAVEV